MVILFFQYSAICNYENLPNRIINCQSWFKITKETIKNCKSLLNFCIVPKQRNHSFVDVEGTKEVKRMINLLAITVNLYHEIDADPSGSGSKTDRVRKQQMLIKHT